MKSLEELDQLICQTLKIDYSKYLQMTLMEQFDVRSKYVKLKNNQKKSK
jgi:hypothetical protein